MIKIKKSLTADTRSCDWSKVTKEQLLESSKQHIDDVKKGMDLFKNMIDDATKNHDFDKISNIDGFYSDFITGFKSTIWFEEHQKINRHHLLNEKGIPENINLIDVLEMITDCVMAGMGRTGHVYPLEIPPVLLKQAFDNTVELIKSKVIVEDFEV